jgi:hypothetical protein
VAVEAQLDLTGPLLGVAGVDVHVRLAGDAPHRGRGRELTADLEEEVRAGHQARERRLVHPEELLALVVDDAVAVLEPEVPGDVLEPLDQVGQAMDVLRRVDRREPVDPERLDAEAFEAQHVLQPHPYGAAEVRPAAGPARADDDPCHPVASAVSIMAGSTLR